MLKTHIQLSPIPLESVRKAPRCCGDEVWQQHLGIPKKTGESFDIYSIENLKLRRVKVMFGRLGTLLYQTAVVVVVAVAVAAAGISYS